MRSAAPGRVRDGLTPLRRRAPGLAALLTSAMGAVDVWSALTHPYDDRLRTLRAYLPGGLITASAAATLVTGVLLVLLGHGLQRSKRRAWRGTVTLLAASAVLHLVKGLDVEEASLALLLLVLLVLEQDRFRAQGDPRTRWRAVLAGLLLTGCSVALGTALVAIRRAEVLGGWQPRLAVEHVLLGLVGIAGPLQFRPGAAGATAAEVVRETTLAFGVVTVVVTTYLALRPEEPAPRQSDTDRARLRALLSREGDRDSLGYFALRSDKSVAWSASGKAAVAYRVLSGVLLSSGDPVGDPEAWPGAVTEVRRLASEHGWAPAVLGCGERGVQAWVRAGLDALEIGDEAVLDVSRFTLEGRAMRSVRQAVRRVERAGYCSWATRVRDLAPADADRLRECSRAWRRGSTERGFSMALGRLGDSADGDCLVVAAERDGVLMGFLQFVPWGTEGLSLDLMRRSRDADNGVNDFLVARAVEWSRGAGVRRISLNFTVFRSALERGERIGAGPVARAWRRALLLASRWVQIESLYRFNARFRPEWEPRFLAYVGPGDLPRVTVAVLRAEAFLPWSRPPD